MFLPRLFTVGDLKRVPNCSEQVELVYVVEIPFFDLTVVIADHHIIGGVYGSVRIMFQPLPGSVVPIKQRKVLDSTNRELFYRNIYK